MNGDRIVVELPQVDRETFDRRLIEMEAATAQMAPSEPQERLREALARMRSRLSQE